MEPSVSSDGDVAPGVGLLTARNLGARKLMLPSPEPRSRVDGAEIQPYREVVPPKRPHSLF